MAKEKKGKSLVERLAEKRKNLKTGGSGYKFFTPKEGTTRFRILNVDDNKEKDWAMEVTGFYLGKDLGFVISPKNFGEKCAIMKTYNKFADSANPKDKEFAKNWKPSKKYVAPAIRFLDEKGKEVDTEAGAKLLLLGVGAYGQLLDLYLDTAEAGDFTDTQNGYDIKIIRTGKGKQDTEYNVTKCKETPTPKAFRKEVNLEEMVKAITPSYEETKEMIEKFLQIDPNELDGGTSSDKKDKKDKKKKKKKNKDL